uniref:SAP domain-containing protein n=1 Tax=Araucaria cunninghamii TaxID=56994 RepID=A0A0D6QU78_ARACU
MRFSLSKVLILALATSEVAVASNWFPGSKAAYNKWHETELERWLSDHDVPYPAASDRKDLENLVKDNWQAKFVDPVTAAGYKVDHESHNIKEWIFDTWTESSLKKFLDHYKIPNPQPRTRDTLLTSARQNYDSVAKKLNQYSAYPGDWLYQTWSESDLKEFLDSRGIPAPQPSTRDRLVATVRRNARLAGLKMSDGASSVSSAASEATDTASSYLFDTWSDSKLKEFLDEQGVPIPQGSKKNEMIALARKQRAKLTGNAASSASASGESAYGAATSSAGNAYAQATDGASVAASDAFEQASNTWSDSRLKAYLDARGVPVPQSGKRDDLLSAVRLNAHKASTGWSAWTFDTWTVENLQNYLSANGKKVKKQANANREQLLKQAQEAYASASKSGGTGYASVTNYLAKQTDAAKSATFDTWSESDLKSYLDSYGVPNYQGSNINELRAMARKQATYFRYGTSSPSETIFERLKGGVQWVMGLVQGQAAAGSVSASKAATSLASAAAHSTASAKNEL